MDLSPKHKEQMDDYRSVVEGLSSDKYDFTLFPKDAVQAGGSVSILLREQFCFYDPTCLPAALFRRNKGLRGALRVTHQKAYKDTDKTRAGQSKKGVRVWRTRKRKRTLSQLHVHARKPELASTET